MLFCIMLWSLSIVYLNVVYASHCRPPCHHSCVNFTHSTFVTASLSKYRQFCWEITLYLPTEREMNATVIRRAITIHLVFFRIIENNGSRIWYKHTVASLVKDAKVSDENDKPSKIFPLGRGRGKVPRTELVIFLDTHLSNTSPLPLQMWLFKNK